MTGGQVSTNGRMVQPMSNSLPLRAVVSTLKLAEDKGPVADGEQASFTTKIAFKLEYEEGSYIPIVRQLADIIRLRKQVTEIGCKFLVESLHDESSDHMYFLKQLKSDGHMSFLDDVNLLLFLQECIDEQMAVVLGYLQRHKMSFAEKATITYLEQFFTPNETDLAAIDLIW